MEPEGSVFASPPPPPRNLSAPELSVGFILSPNFTLLAFAGFIESLRHAADHADFSRQIYCRWSIVGPDLRRVRASCGVEVVPWQSFEQAPDFDYIAIVGGLLPSCLEHPPKTFDFIRERARCGTPLIGLCTGSFVLAKAGLMDGKRCALAVDHKSEFSQLFPKGCPVTDKTYVSDEGVLTCPGGTASIDLATAIISRHCGKARAVKCLHSMLLEKHRAEHHIPIPVNDQVALCGNAHVEKAVAFMEENIGISLRIKDLARKLGITMGQLERAFAEQVGMTPTAFWWRMRLEHAHWLLCNTTRRITDIALECGFYDSTHFSRRFKAFYRETPREHRKRNREILSYPRGANDTRSFKVQ